jgi:hypothetical protein
LKKRATASLLNTHWASAQLSRANPGGATAALLLTPKWRRFIFAASLTLFFLRHIKVRCHDSLSGLIQRGGFGGSGF